MLFCACAVFLFPWTRTVSGFVFLLVAFHNDWVTEMKKIGAPQTLFSHFYWPCFSSSFLVTQWLPCGYNPFHRTMRRKFTLCPLKHIEQAWRVFMLWKHWLPLEQIWRVTWCRRPPPKPYMTDVSLSFSLWVMAYRPEGFFFLSAYGSQTQQNAQLYALNSKVHNTKPNNVTEVTHLRPQRPHAGAFNPHFSCCFLYLSIYSFWWISQFIMGEFSEARKSN